MPGLDGGRPQFNNLLFHRGEVSFLAFDLLMSDGRDLRTERLADRKHELRRLLSKTPESRMRYVEHVEQYGTALFQRVCNIPLPTTRAFALSPVVSAGSTSPEFSPYHPENPSFPRLPAAAQTPAQLIYPIAQSPEWENKVRNHQAKPIAPPRPPHQRLHPYPPIASAPA